MSLVKAEIFKRRLEQAGQGAFDEAYKYTCKISVCIGNSCFLGGASKIIRAFEKELAIKLGESKDSDLFSLEQVSCLGGCRLRIDSFGPRTQLYEGVTEADVVGIIEEQKDLMREISIKKIS